MEDKVNIHVALSRLSTLYKQAAESEEAQNNYEDLDKNYWYKEKIIQAELQVKKSLDPISSRVNSLFIKVAASNLNDHIKNHMYGLLDAVDKDLKNISLVVDKELSFKDQAAECYKLLSSFNTNERRLDNFEFDLVHHMSRYDLEQHEQATNKGQPKQTSKAEQPKQKGDEEKPVEKNADKEQAAVNKPQDKGTQEQTAAKDKQEPVKETAIEQNSTKKNYATNSQSIMEGVEYSFNSLNNIFSYQEESETNQNDAPADFENPENNDVQNSENENSEQTQKRGYYTSMELEDLMKRFASVHSNFYNKDGKHTKEEIAEKRRVNYAMKKIIDKKINELATNRKNKLKDENLIKKIKNPDIDPKDIDALVKNELAVAKLFKIQASGVYEKNGQSIKLSQKQRTAIASVLVKVCEKQDEIEQTKVDEKAAGKTASKDIAKQAKNIAKESELGGE